MTKDKKFSVNQFKASNKLKNNLYTKNIPTLKDLIEIINGTLKEWHCYK